MAHGVGCMVNVSDIHMSLTQSFCLTAITYGHQCVNWCMILLFATASGCIRIAARERDVIPWAVLGHHL
jgi:hypothetical protein